MNEKTRPSGARFVALGILASRIFGLLRQTAIGWFFALGPHADVLTNAFRAPNVLQNLLGEQALSASFIPVYSRMLAAGRHREAGRFAGAIFGLLVAAVSLLVLLGIVFARPIVSLLAAGFRGDAQLVAAGELDVNRLELTVTAVRIIFPMTGFLVLAAWALGVLNSHRRFLLPYLAPVIWNSAILAALCLLAWQTGFLTTPTDAGLAERESWLFAVCFGALLGGGLQFAVQLPLVLRLMGGLRVSLSLRVAGVREALVALGPALIGRGVVQLSLYLDLFLANWLKTGAAGAIGFAGVLFNLPLGVFGMSVAAAELPELSRSSRTEAGARIPDRLEWALRQSAFVICPAVVGYLVFGFLVVGLIYPGGQFTVEDNWLVYTVLCGYTLGLIASAVSRILQNTFFALRDTRTPAKIAAVRVAASALVGVGLMLWLDRFSVARIFGVEDASKGLHLGALGLSLAAATAAWAELVLLRRALGRRVPELKLPVGAILKLLLLAALTAVPALVLWYVLPISSVPLQALVVLPCYALSYLGLAWWRRLPELDLWLGRLRRGS